MQRKKRKNNKGEKEGLLSPFLFNVYMRYDIIYIDNKGQEYTDGDFSMCSPYVKNLILSVAEGEPLPEILSILIENGYIHYVKGIFERR